MNNKNRRFLFCLLVGILTIPALAGAQTTPPEPTIVQWSSGLNTLLAGETKVVRIVETNRDAGASDVAIWLLDDRDRIVGKTITVFGPGRPAVLQVPFSQIGSQERSAAVRVVIRLRSHELSGPVATSESQNIDQLMIRTDPPCNGQGQGGVPGSADCQGWMNITL